MTQIKNNINTYADLTAYNADTNKEERQTSRRKQKRTTTKHINSIWEGGPLA